MIFRRFRRAGSKTQPLMRVDEGRSPALNLFYPKPRRRRSSLNWVYLIVSGLDKRIAAPRQKGFSAMTPPAVNYARGNQQRFLTELKDLLRIPSISTLTEHKSDVQKAAEFVAAEMRRIGLEHVEVIPTKGHPLIYADWIRAPGKPTALCYAHYDVQPPDPLDEWVSPPFEPTERNNNIYARGAVDDKGQLWMEIKAIEALMKGHGGKLPLNVKFIIEGEEEVGGESIAEYVRKQQAKLKAWKKLPFDEEQYRKTEVGSTVLTGEPGFSVLYRTWARPTLEVHGMPGGFTAPGAKTVIPAKASAKVSMRLVPNQDPDDILERFKKYVKKLTPKGIQTNVKVWSKGPACVVGTNNKYIKAATEAMHEIFKKDTVFIRSGGSIPIVTDFQDVLKIPSVMMGFGLPDDNLHAPNEKFHIPNFYRGIETICVFFEKLGGK